MRISDWSSDVCSSDLPRRPDLPGVQHSRGRADKGRRDQAQQTGDTAMSTVAMPDHATAAEPDRATPMVRFEKVTKSYGSLVVLDQLDLDIAPGEKDSLIGPSGSGKTTVLRTLMSLERITGGN